MRVLRIRLSQTKAHYRKEETNINKMTYPLPPLSTVIGALHNACGFRKYRSMELSIQGRYASLSRQAYTDYCFLDSVMDDRGILVKMKNSLLHSSAYEKVGVAMKSQGNSFRKDVTIQVYNKNLMREYRDLKDTNDKISEFKKNRLKKVKELFRARKKSLSIKKKSFEKESLDYKKIQNREKEIKNKEKFINDKVREYEEQNYTNEISKYQSLTTALKFYEILHDVVLIIHVKSDEETLQSIKENIYNLKAIGRSEDFVDVKECEFVELRSPAEIEDTIISDYSSYLPYKLIKSRYIFFGSKKKEGIKASGTRYKINAVYSNEKGYRDFKKADVLYSSDYKIDDESENVWIDENYIVAFHEERDYVGLK